MSITISGNGITSANILDGTITNADVNDVAASKLTGTLPAIDGSALTGISGGKVLQVVHSKMARDGGTASTTSTSYIDTGLSASITPTTSGNKIIIIAHLGFRNLVTTGNDGDVAINLMRDTTEMTYHHFKDDNMGKLGDAVYLAREAVFNEEFTTTSTSSITFKLQGKRTVGTLWYKYNGGSITLMEIEV